MVMIKNIHILPTDKSSRLIKDVWNNTFSIVENFNRNHTDFKGNYIYITSDEEIKDGDWAYHSNHKSIMKIGVGESKLMKGHIYLKKIILTTDLELKLQSIDDEFLEWFVKNPSCEFIKVGIGFSNEDDITDISTDYELIIPKEETLEETSENWLDKYSDKFEIIKSKFLPFHFNNRNELKELINEVIKWQQERMYSEEEIHKIIESYKNNKPKVFLKVFYNEWFEKFKKK